MAEGQDMGSYKDEIEKLRNRLKAMEERERPSSAGFEQSAFRGIDTAIEASHKTVLSNKKDTTEDAESPQGPVGLDVGTSNIVMAQSKGNTIDVTKQLNAFFTVPRSKFTKKILQQNDVTFFEQDNQYYIIGYSAESFANMFNANTRRPMYKGLLSSKENESVNLIQAIINTLIQKPKKFGEIICFSVPGEPLGEKSYVAGHESIVKMYLESLGYTPISINEGLAIVMSELSENNFTGIGISMGGGMCNICLAYLSVPVITFSIQLGGDYIDAMVGAEVDESATKIKVIKEETLNLSVLPRNKVETALHIHYMEVIQALVKSIERVVSSSDKIPKISFPIPIVLSGGTAMPKGCKDKFEKALKTVDLPMEISGVFLAQDPLNTTAKGALVMALAEES